MPTTIRNLNRNTDIANTDAPANFTHPQRLLEKRERWNKKICIWWNWTNVWAFSLIFHMSPWLLYCCTSNENSNSIIDPCFLIMRIYKDTHRRSWLLQQTMITAVDTWTYWFDPQILSVYARNSLIQPPHRKPFPWLSVCIRASPIMYILQPKGIMHLFSM